MKKVNFKKTTSQFFAGVFGLALMGGVMLNTQDVEAQETDPLPISGGKKCQTADASGGGGAFFYRLCGTCKTKFMTRGTKSTC